MPDLNVEDIRRELVTLRAEIAQMTLPLKGTEWSAHANWKNKSSNLLGDYDFTSQFRVPQEGNVPALLESVIKDSSNERFVQVARSLSEMLRG